MYTLHSRQFREVFITKLVFNLKSEASKTYLGYLWWLVEPVLYVIALYVVFGRFLQIRTGNFILFLVCGQIPFMWFSKSVSNSSRSIVAGKGLISQVAIPKAFFPLLAVSQDLVKQLVVFIAMLGFVLAMGEGMTIHWLGLAPIIVVQFGLIVAVALFVSSIVPVFPDFRFLIKTGLTILMFGSGIFYSYEAVLLPEHRAIFLMNPMANLIKNYRDVLMYGQFPDWSALLAIAMLLIVLIVVMLLVLRRYDSAYARLIIQ